MTIRPLAISGVAVGVLALVGFVGYEVGLERGRAMMTGVPSVSADIVAAANARAAVSVAVGAAPTKPGDVDPSNGKRVLYWHDPMMPATKFERPGKSPFMDMQLVPVYADDAGDRAGVAIDPRLRQSLGIRTARAVTGSLASALSVVGNVGYNERDVVVVQARASGFVEKLFVRAALDPVRKGQPLAQLYAPEWVAAQEEYLAAKRLRRDVDGLALGGLADAAAQRMRLAGMTDQQIREVDAKDAVQTRFTITSPIDGVVGELSASEGMTVAMGTPLFRLNGLATVWVNAEVPEGAVAEVRPGNTVTARTPALRGTVFNGRVSAILPEVDATTRTIKARIELANPGSRLVPGMFATIDFAPAQRQDSVLVPSEAVIATGRRAVVIVALEEGRFTPIDVEVGREANDQTEIIKGIRAGDEVVVSGQFLIDSEANLKAALARMNDMPKGVSGIASMEASRDEAAASPGHVMHDHSTHDAAGMHENAAEHDRAMHQHPGMHDDAMKSELPAK